MAFLFDTNAISELYKPLPNSEYLAWLGGIPRRDQYTSAQVIAELLYGAHSSPSPAKWLRRVREQIVPRLSILPFDLRCAERYGRLRADLKQAGTPIGEVDTQIAATALAHGMTLVTANARHFELVEGLTLKVFRSGGG